MGSKLCGASSKMEQVLISIIVPVRNESHVREWVSRLVLQTQKHEIIVVDTSSTPTLLPDSSFRYFHRPEFQFRSQALNEGARLSKGDLLLFLHADCDLPKDGLYPLQNSSLEGGAFLKEYVPSNRLLKVQSFILNFFKSIT